MSGRLMRVYRGETTIDFLGRRRLWFAISVFLVVGSIVLLFTKELNLGIEFEGGLQITAPIPSDGPVGDASDIDVISEVRDAVTPLGAGEATIQVATKDENRKLVLQTDLTGDRAERLQQAVSGAIGGPSGDQPCLTEDTWNCDEIGAKWGQEITSKALRGLVIFLVLVVLFISWRFEWKMAVAAIVALIHDLTITAGVYSLSGFEVTPATVIALLTILGYSLYDTVVVFDKVEEDTTMLAATGRMTYQDAANRAMNEVFMRSLNTSLATLLPVAALLVVGAGLVGAGTLEDLALALLVGILLGAYSSIFLATPILTMFKEREPRYKNVREKVLRDAKRSQRKPTAAPVPSTEGSATDGEPKTPAKAPAKAPAKTPAARSSSSRPSPKGRAGSKKSKRRKKR